MPNSVEKFKKYTTRLDKGYQQSAKTSVLDGDNDVVRMGANAGEFLIPLIDMDGLGDYDRNKGYPEGSASIAMQVKKCDYDRGRRFTVDTMDNEETAGLLFGQLAGEFIRTKVVPELDAYRFAKYASIDGISSDTGDLYTGKEVLNALRKAKTQMQDNEVDLDDLLLFISPGLVGAVQDIDTTVSREVMKSFSQVIEVPRRRFYTAIDLINGRDDDELMGGFKPADGAYPINFLMLDKKAVIQYQKHIVNKVISPDDNQTTDGWMFFYRAYGIAECYNNKKTGIYLHHGTEAIGG